MRIVSSLPDVLKYVDRIRQAADSDRESLGFLPYSAYYDQFALKGNILVAVIDSFGSVGDYVGHLLFDLSFPHAKVRQIYVSPPHRGARIAARLVEHLKSYLTDLQFVAVHARVGEDLLTANRFWQAQGFHTRQVVPGGAARGRMIAVRSCELRVPSLFDVGTQSNAHPLALNLNSIAERPTYLLDLNVLFDMGPRRVRRPDVMNVFRAERMRVCDLAISSEISDELSRSCSLGKTDPMRDFASILPTYDVPKGEGFERLLEELLPLVFPDQARAGQLSLNDRSDLRHLATVVGHRLRGLITSDGTILRAAPILQKRYAVEILSPEQFSLPDSDVVDEEIKTASDEVVLRLEAVEQAHEERVRALLASCGVSVADQNGSWAVSASQRSCSRFGVWRNEDLVGYLTWPKSLREDVINANVVVAQSNGAAQNAAKIMLTALADISIQAPASVVRLSFPDRQQELRNVALSYGYMGSDSNATQLQKITVGRLVGPQNWTLIVSKLEGACGVRLPLAIPAFRGVGQQLEIAAQGGGRSFLSLLEIESAFAPALLCLPGREGVLVPIQRKYSEHLLQHLDQGSLLPKERAKLYSQRHYFSSPRTRSVFKGGDLMFFYESGKGKGVGGVVAVARVVRAYLRRQDAVDAEDLGASVLDERELEKIGRSPLKTVTVFDNLNKFVRPIPRSTLESIGCGAPNQLMSSRRLTSAQVQGILQKAF